MIVLILIDLLVNLFLLAIGRTPTSLRLQRPRREETRDDFYVSNKRKANLRAKDDAQLPGAMP